jgi:hypothetical protein
MGLRRAGSAALAQFIVVAGGSADLRWALVALALRSLAVIGASCRVLLVGMAQSAARRITRKAGLAPDVAPADTTLAAGQR